MKTKQELDIVDLLIEQHARIRDLFSEVESSSGEGRRTAFQRLTRLLAVHETAEEEIVHPIARRTLVGGEGLIADRLREERDAKHMLAELDGMDTDDPEFMPKLNELRVAVLDHARAEERYEFYRLRGTFSETQRRGMAAALKAAEATAPTHPHPGTESAKKNLAAGPLVALVDRLRDAIRNS
ncbi:hemerythrin domain-containing protein [Actinomadura craniellae]|uniref:Hemerythrin domain-containing protein n=1 Tax=Actinomadura craniellae TaxID=2231787 RepID=A0A365GWT9_9ACTN|nr:hemerythrin domain-containing protein [Actinomadura craniellae]RAY11228.1 hemerythrin domain-containing protein [Actinomadura craniellae]